MPPFCAAPMTRPVANGIGNWNQFMTADPTIQWYVSKSRFLFNNKRSFYLSSRNVLLNFRGIEPRVQIERTAYNCEVILFQSSCQVWSSLLPIFVVLRSLNSSERLSNDIFILFFSLAKEEKAVKEEREERPQPRRKHPRRVRVRLVCNSPWVVCTVSSRSRYTKGTASEPLPLCTLQLFWNILQRKFLNWQEMLAKI